MHSTTSKDLSSLSAVRDEPVSIQMTELSGLLASIASVDRGQEVSISTPPAKITLHGELTTPALGAFIEPHVGMLSEHFSPVGLDDFCDFYPWPGTWLDPHQAYDQDWVAGWVAGQWAACMGGQQEFPNDLWQMPQESAPSLPPLQMPPAPAAEPPLLKESKSAVYSGESTEADDLSSGDSSENESSSSDGLHEVGFDVEKAGVELLAVINSQQSDEEDAGCETTSSLFRWLPSPPTSSPPRPLTPPPGLCEAPLIPFPPGLCSPKSVSPSTGLSLLYSSSLPSCATSHALEEDWSHWTGFEEEDWSHWTGFDSDDGEENFSFKADCYEEAAPLSSCNDFVRSSNIFDESDGKSSESERKQDPIARTHHHCRKLSQFRQQRTPGSSQKKKVRAQMLHSSTQVEAPTHCRQVIADVVTMAEHDSDRACESMLWHMLPPSTPGPWVKDLMLLLTGLVVASIIILLVVPQCCADERAYELITSPAVVAGSSHVWTAAVPGAASLQSKHIALIANSMDVELARGHAVASHLMIKLKGIRRSLNKLRRHRKRAGRP